MLFAPATYTLGQKQGQRMLKANKVPDLREKGFGGKTEVYSKVKKGLLPPPVKIGRSSIWPEAEIDQILAAHIRGEAVDEIKALVRNLVSARLNFWPDQNRQPVKGSARSEGDMANIGFNPPIRSEGSIDVSNHD